MSSDVQGPVVSGARVLAIKHGPIGDGAGVNLELSGVEGGVDQLCRCVPPKTGAKAETKSADRALLHVVEPTCAIDL